MATGSSCGSRAAPISTLRELRRAAAVGARSAPPEHAGRASALGVDARSWRARAQFLRWQSRRRRSDARRTSGHDDHKQRPASARAGASAGHRHCDRAIGRGSQHHAHHGDMARARARRCVPARRSGVVVVRCGGADQSQRRRARAGRRHQDVEIVRGEVIGLRVPAAPDVQVSAEAHDNEWVFTLGPRG